MGAHQRLLLLLGAIALCAYGCLRPAEETREPSAPSLRTLPQRPAALAANSHAACWLASRTADRRAPRTANGDGAPPDASPAKYWEGATARTDCGSWLGIAIPNDRAVVAQSYLRVNGSANAHGARA